MHKNAQHTADESMTLVALSVSPLGQVQPRRGPWGAPWTLFWGSLASLGHSLASLGDFAGLLEPHPSLLGLSLATFIVFLVLRGRILLIFRCFWCPLVFSAPSGLAEKTEVFSISRLDAS